MYCLCVNVYCHRVITQLQLINIIIINVQAYRHIVLTFTISFRNYVDSYSYYCQFPDLVFIYLPERVMACVLEDEKMADI